MTERKGQKDDKKSLKIPKGQSESVYRRSTDNTMTERKGQKDDKKSLKIPKGQSESVYQRRTDNTMTERKKDKRTRRVWRYQRGNQNPYIEEEQTPQWPKEKVQKDKQRSTKHKTKDRVTWTPVKTGGELRCSGRVGSSCSTSGTRRNLVTKPVDSHEWWKDREVFTTRGTYPNVYLLLL